LACVDRADLIRFVSIGLRQNLAMLDREPLCD